MLSLSHVPLSGTTPSSAVIYWTGKMMVCRSGTMYISVSSISLIFFFYCRLTCFQIQICRMWPTVPSVTEECLMGLWWHWWRKVNSHCERLARHFDALERPCLSSSHSSLSVFLSVSQPQEFPCPSSSTLHRFFTSFHFYTLGCSIVFIGSQECLCDFWPWALRTKSIRVCQHRFI